MIDLKDIRLVQAVAEHGTLVRAARILGVSQPTLTRSLAVLEAKLKGPLFERRRHGCQRPMNSPQKWPLKFPHLAAVGDQPGA